MKRSYSLQYLFTLLFIASVGCGASDAVQAQAEDDAGAGVKADDYAPSEAELAPATPPSPPTNAEVGFAGILPGDTLEAAWVKLKEKGLTGEVQEEEFLHPEKDGTSWGKWPGIYDFVDSAACDPLRGGYYPERDFKTIMVGTPKGGIDGLALTADPATRKLVTVGVLATDSKSEDAPDGAFLKTLCDKYGTPEQFDSIDQSINGPTQYRHFVWWQKTGAVVYNIQPGFNSILVTYWGGDALKSILHEFGKYVDTKSKEKDNAKTLF